MTGACARQYACSTCGRVEVESRGQAHVIFIDRHGSPRTYELCSVCTERVRGILEGYE